MKTSAKTLCIGCTAAFLSGGSAWAQEACSTYVVVAGDNLRFIARQAYDDADL
jgi:nucleoid-associated protein YgaU